MSLNCKHLSNKEVRLFSSQNIKSDREAELRATASFLAVARAVSEFGRRVVSIAGGPCGKLSCYAEVPFKVQKNGAKFHEEREERPDGVMYVTHGRKNWSALIEVKVGNNLLEQNQFSRYHDLACDQGINALITITNQSALANGLPPQLTVAAKLFKKVPVVHLSWERLLSEAKVLIRQKGVADTDQQWMLEEWIRYVDDPQSRIIEPPQMGEYWNDVLRYASEHNLTACKDQMRDVMQHWDAFLRKVALRLRAKLGANVKLKISNAEHKDPTALINNLHTKAIKKGELSGVFMIPDAAGDLSVVVLLPPRTVQYSIDVEAPTEGKATTRIKWMLKQLSSPDVPDDLVVQVHWGWGLSSQGRIKDLKEQIDILRWDSNGQKVPDRVLPRSFSLKWTIGLPKGKARSTAPVLEGIYRGFENFYKCVAEGIRPFVPKAPQLLKEEARKEDTSGDDQTKERHGEPEILAMPQLVVESEQSR